MAAAKAVPDEWQEDTIFFLLAVEECADMPRLIQPVACKRYWLRYLLHKSPSRRMAFQTPSHTMRSSSRETIVILVSVWTFFALASGH
jgi:hypothetical protein